MKRNIVIIAGEPSGDSRGGELIKKLKTLLPETSFWGIGGDHMEQEGMKLVEHIRDLSIVGLLEAVKSLPKIHRQYTHLTKTIKERKPALAILIDYPGFNLKIAKFLHKEKIPVIYYVIPQIWAWGYSRINLLKRYVDKALVLFKFEEDLLRKAGINCQCVGHPLLDNICSDKDTDHRIPETERDQFTIALLPGSRKSEVKHMFPSMLETAERLTTRLKNIRFIVARSSNVDKSLYDEPLADHKGLPIRFIKDDTLTVLGGSDFGIVASGTATLEAAVMETPMVIIYRTPLMLLPVLRVILKVPHIGLSNIIAGKEISPELLQKSAAPENLTRTVLKIIEDRSRMQTMKNDLIQVKRALGEKGASRRTAKAIKIFLDNKISV